MAYLETDSPINFGSNGNCNNGAWGDFSWIIGLALIGALFGNGGFGFGGGFGGGRGQGFYDTNAEIQRGFDNQSVLNKLNGLENGLCDGFYAVNTAFGNLNTNLCNQFAGVTNAITTGGYETRSAISDLGYRLQDCCCKIEKGQMETNYLNAQNTCAITNAISNSTRDIIENANANARYIHEELVANKLEAKDEKIADLRHQLDFANLAQSQANQNAYFAATIDASRAELVRRLGRDYPVNAVVVQPNTPVSFPTNCCGQATFGGYNGCGSCGTSVL